jgi:hypothetical protein
MPEIRGRSCRKPERQLCCLSLSLMDTADIRLNNFGDADSRLEEV